MYLLSSHCFSISLLLVEERRSRLTHLLRLHLPTYIMIHSINHHAEARMSVSTLYYECERVCMFVCMCVRTLFLCISVTLLRCPLVEGARSSSDKFYPLQVLASLAHSKSALRVRASFPCSLDL
jgi:hypothetical protein